MMASLLVLLCAVLLVSLDATVALQQKPSAWKQTRGSSTPSTPSPSSLPLPLSAVYPKDNQRSLPYPTPPLPTTVYAYDPDAYTPDDTFLILTLQGSLARLNAQPTPPQPLAPLLYHVTGSNRTEPEWTYWAEYQRLLPSITFSTRLLNASADALIGTFRRYIVGAYLTALGTDSVNACVSFASTAPSLICATDAHLPLLKSLNVPIVQNLTTLTETAFIDAHLTADAWPFSTRFLSAQLPEKAVTSLSDWTMLLGAVQLHQTDNYQRVLQFLHTHHPTPVFNAVFGWVTTDSSEHDFTGNASAAGAGVLASDWLNNGATHASLAQAWRGGLTNPTKSDPTTLPDNRDKHTVSLLLTDGDNICSDMNLLLDRGHWAHPKRGSIPIGWGLNPTLALTLPIGLRTYYEQAVPANDGFVAFSAQYAFPDNMQADAVQQWAELSGQAMAAADMRVMNFIGNAFNTSSFAPLLNQWNVDGIVYFESAPPPSMTHATHTPTSRSCSSQLMILANPRLTCAVCLRGRSYYGNYVLPEPDNGSVKWVNGKPCIAVRSSLWQDHSTPQSIAKLLNAQSRNHSSTAGYSVIAVHIWSETVDSMMQVAQLLDDDVLLVKPDTLIQLMTQNVIPS